MELSTYAIIKGPVTSEKAFQLNKKLNQLVLEVHPKATKALIKDALEKLFNVKVDKVRTAIRKKSNVRMISRRFNARPTINKIKVAYITLSPGYTLNLFEQMGAASSVEKQGIKEEA